MSDLLPPNATGAERALSLAIARHAGLPTPVRELWDAGTCPPEVLAWLAWALTGDEWDHRWSDAQKRAVIRASLQVHRFKGTIGAVRDALGALSYTARVQEWFAQIPAGAPYTFRVILEVDQQGISQSEMTGLQTVIDRTKNLRSHISRIDPVVTTRTGITVAAVSAVGSELEVAQFRPAALACNETTICL